MSSYITGDQVAQEFGGWPKLNNALDDDGDGQADPNLLDNLIITASNQVDGYLQGRYVTPIAGINGAGPPAIVIEATLIFVVETLYNRRKQGPDEKNPYEGRANSLRDRLKDIQDRKANLNAQGVEANVPGAVFAEESKLRGSSL